MKKLVFIGFAAALCVSCIANPDDQQVPPPAVNAPANVDMSQVYTYDPAVGMPEDVDMSQVYAYDSAVETAAPVVDPKAEADFYRRHILVKGMGDDYVIYEYIDVGIDKVATLAARYCYDKDDRTSAYLRDIYMRKNHKRRATFDCINLARE